MSDTRSRADRPLPERLPLGEASRLLGVDPDTLRRWADEGRVPAFTTPGGHRRFERRALERLVAAAPHRPRERPRGPRRDAGPPERGLPAPVRGAARPAARTRAFYVPRRRARELPRVRPPARRRARPPPGPAWPRPARRRARRCRAVRAARRAPRGDGVPISVRASRCSSSARQPFLCRAVASSPAGVASTPPGSASCTTPRPACWTASCSRSSPPTRSRPSWARRPTGPGCRVARGRAVRGRRPEPDGDALLPGPDRRSSRSCSR